ncbi:serine/threonine protein kinase [Planctomicrobium sp. SH527]|uniref:serine/threonine protein kinase n=1 Tax=Planctomicrobium sp. SH527 TaxID=3448123 RepID=UPI003F5B8140
MPESLQPDDSADADVQGLPLRSGSSGRDAMEEIASKYLDNIRGGNKISLDDFLKSYPSKLAAELRDFLPFVGAMEDWKVQREFKAVHQSLPDQFELKHLGEFRIVREIARGGMGVVFEAEQSSLSRRVAVKLLPWQFPKNSTWADQFVREARIAAQLQHAQIVPVYSFGEQDSRFFYVMQLIEGVGLDKLIDRWKRDHGVVMVDDLIDEFHPATLGNNNSKASKRMLRHDSWQQIAKIATQVVAALRYAHKQGTLHRDIKPGNLLFDRQGKVWITDFGLAVGNETVLSDTTGGVSGTLRYMPPEQFRREGDNRSDLYSFGATLYELCTLQPAFLSKTRQDLVREIERGQPRPPRQINPDIPASLEYIIQKSLKKSVEERYQNADQLYADLLRFINGDQVGETGSSWWSRLFSGGSK